jgi:putative salt-induced outer membrane protein
MEGRPRSAAHAGHPAGELPRSLERQGGGGRLPHDGQFGYRRRERRPRGLRWRHKFHGQADYQSNLNITTREHYLASYEPNYKFDDRAYLYGALQYEGDRFLGYNNRYSASVGAGYSVLKTARTRLDLELGPAYRNTDFTDDTVQSAIAARGTMNFSWRITNGLSVSQIASAYVQRYNSTLGGTTALNAKLIGPLSASLSYTVQYESEPPVGSMTTDTTSRASLVYSF